MLSFQMGGLQEGSLRYGRCLVLVLKTFLFMIMALFFQVCLNTIKISIDLVQEEVLTDCGRQYNFIIIGKIKKILLSGDSGYVFKKGVHESAQLKKMLIAQNIPARDIVIEAKSRNTHENAKETARFLKRNKLNKKTFLLITSAIHMRRAQACFLKEGVTCSSFSTDHYNIDAETASITSLIPSADGFIMWQRIVKEWVGTLTYRISGYI